MTPASGYWFRAKRYGWGWGLPLSWQGWAVLVGFMVLLGAGSLLLSPVATPKLYAAYVATLTAALLGVCAAKGEPPRWRWGGH